MSQPPSPPPPPPPPPLQQQQWHPESAPEPEIRRFAFLNLEDAPKWGDLFAIFTQAIGLGGGYEGPAARIGGASPRPPTPKEQLSAANCRGAPPPPHVIWDQFQCCAGELPTAAQLRTVYSGLLLTGSHHSVNDPMVQATWLPPLCALLRDAATLPHLRVVGGCFGCQCIAIALGGEVGANPNGDFVFRAESVHTTPALWEFLRHNQSTVHKGDDNFNSNTRSADDTGGGGGPTSSLVCLRLLESHGEQVLRMPPRAVPLASSPGAQHEIFLAGPHRNLLACQSHPELSIGLLYERIAPALQSRGLVSEETLWVARKDMDNGLDSELGCALYSGFLLGAGLPPLS